jgi:hypothetical protein
VFDRIVNAAWQTGDPGLVFIDRVNRGSANPVPDLETIEATNPCGEQPLAPNDACNLGSINLDKFARPGDPKAPIAWDALERTVRLAVRFLDDVIQVNPHPLPEIMEEVIATAGSAGGDGLVGSADSAGHPAPTARPRWTWRGRSWSSSRRSAATNRRGWRRHGDHSPTGPRASTGTADRCAIPP